MLNISKNSKVPIMDNIEKLKSEMKKIHDFAISKLIDSDDLKALTDGTVDSFTLDFEEASVKISKEGINITPKRVNGFEDFLKRFD